MEHTNFYPDVIALSETKLKENEVCNHFIHGYNFVHKGTPTSWGGVRLFVKKHINFSICSDFNFDIPECENLWIKLNLSDSKKCIVGVIYRHPKQNIAEFHSSMENLLEKLNQTKLIYYICGDINIDLLKTDKVQSIKNYTDMICSLGSIPLIKHPTRITQTSSTLIDHIYTNNVPDNINSCIILNDVSDHLPIAIIIDQQKEKLNCNKTIKVRDMKNFILEDFLENLSENMPALHNSSPQQDVQFYMEKFIEIFKTTLNKHAPLRNKSRREIKTSKKPWITKGILQSIQQKDKLYRQNLKNKDGESWMQFKSYRNKLTHVKEHAKKLHLQNIIKESRHNTSLLWKEINKIL